MENMNNSPQYQRKLLRRLILPGGKLSYHGIADWFLVSVFVLPMYFGVRLVFFDLTPLRFFEVLLIICIMKNNIRRQNFINLMKKCPNNVWIGAYLIVVVYTNLIHLSINTVIYWITNGVLLIFCIAYLVVYEYGINGFLFKLRKYTWILCILSPMEIFLGKSPFAFLDTLGKVATSERFESVRISGNLTVANGYAMYLMILFPIICYDLQERKINMGKNKWLLGLIAINILLTGSRLTVGTLVLGVVVCFFAQNKGLIKKQLIIIMILIPIVCWLIYVFRNVSLIRGLIRTMLSTVDEILGTNYAIRYGADATTLYNSSYYRELLWKNTIGGGWLNPFLGKGGNYHFGMYVDGYRIFSIDNFYVYQYITYAWPGVITWLIMSLSFLKTMAIKIKKNNYALGKVLGVSFVCYFISLWYLDQLQTFQMMMSIFGMSYGISKLYE